MNSTRESIQSIIPEQLHNTTRLVNAGKYADALKVIRTAKNAHPRNIYIIALEKQVERLSILSQSGRLSRQMKDEILGSLPGLVDRATFEIEDRDLPPRATAAPSPVPTATIVNEKPAKDPVANNLKQQYFDQAERFITRGAYDNAMAEIRRIQMIDPENELAREIEEKILKLAEKRLKGPSVPLQQEVPVDVSKHLLNHRTDEDEDDVDRSFGQRMPSFAGPQRDILFEEPEKEYVPARPPILFVAAILVLFAMAAGAYYYFSTTPNAELNTIDEEVSKPSESFKFMGKEEKLVANPEAPTVTDSVTRTQGNSQNGEMLKEATPEVRALDANAPGLPVAKQSAKEERTASPPQKPLPTDAIGKEPTPLISSIGTAQKPAPQPVVVQPVDTSPNAQPSNEEAVTFANFEVAPRVLQLQEPAYPDSAKKAGLSGQVIIHVQLDTQGKPISARVFKSSNSIFETPSIVAALKSSYSPAQTANGPAIAWISVPFLFRPQ